MIFTIITQKGKITLNVKLLTSTQSIHDMEHFAALAALTCHANTDKMSNEDYLPSDTLKNIIKAGHESILEHINLTFKIEGLSRACLQELARHRHISLSVESTRHTLLKKLYGSWEELNSALIGKKVPKLEFKNINLDLRKWIICFLEKICYQYPEMTNDELKYFLPEFWPTNLIITLNVREFRHILKLRTAPAALKEFRILARSMFHEVPDEFKYLLQDCVHEEE